LDLYCSLPVCICATGDHVMGCISCHCSLLTSLCPVFTDNNLLRGTDIVEENISRNKSCIPIQGMWTAEVPHGGALGPLHNIACQMTIGRNGALEDALHLFG
jgi:hypothetical protein